MTRTRFLLTLLLVAILLRLFPDRSAFIEQVAVGGAALYCLIWLGSRFLGRYRLRRQQDRLAAADAAEYRDYERELADIRARTDESSPQFQVELSALHERHRDMLTRKFGAG